MSSYSTPMKDRDRHPFPQSSQPSPVVSVRQNPASFANIPAAVQAAPQTLTVDALLTQHASSSDPKGAALEQAVNDRNVLSAQNAQLWKLIEKQRAGYNQILKELERIRGERDTYKTRLGALGVLPNGSSDKRQKTTSERTSRPSIDTISSVASSVAPQTRQPLGRHNSDDPASTPRNPHHQLHPSRSFEPMSGRPSENGVPSNATHPATPTRSESPSLRPPPQSAPTPISNRQYRPSPSPLVVPSRTESYSLNNSPQHATGDNTNANNSVVNGIHSSSRPLAHPRKSSLAESFSSLSGSSISTSSPATSVSGSLHNYGGNPASAPYLASQQSYHTGGTPQTAPAGFNASPVADSPQSLQMSPTSMRPPILTSRPFQDTVTPTNTSISPLQQAQSQSHTQMLTAVPDNRPHFLSRDSRISLPDEARQYIANMADSPLPSPRVDSFSPKSRLATSVFPPVANGTMSDSGRESEFLDMDEEESDDESEVEGAGDVTAGAGDPAFDTLRTRAHLPTAEGNSDYESSLYPPQPEYLSNHSHSSNSSREDVDSIHSKKKEKSRVVAEEFPLPPPSNILIQRQQQQPTTSQDGQYYGQRNPSQQSLQVQPPSIASSSPVKHTQAMDDQYPLGATSGGHNQAPHEQPMQQEPSSQQSLASFQQQTEQEQPGIQSVPASFRALPLLSSDLPHTNISVSHSFVRPNDRGKEVLSFIVFVNPGNGKEGWKVEKMYSDVLGLDQRVRNSVGKGVLKKIGNLPEGKLWKDHAPAKVDQRKAVLENYLQTLIQLPVKNNDEVIAFFTSDIVREQKQPVMQAGHKEGYLTKRGKNFGGWKTRFFVLQGPVLEYYDCRGGAHLGSITITGAQIARQHRTEKPPTTDDEKEYRHAFLIVEAKKGPGGNHPRHVLCAESDEDRDSWVEMLVRYYTGTYSEDLVFNPTSGLTSVQSTSVAASSASQQSGGMAPPRSSTSSNEMSASPSGPRTNASKPVVRGPATPISQVPSDVSNPRLFQSAPSQEDYTRSSSPSRSIDPSPIDRQGTSAPIALDSQKRMMDRSGLGLPSSLPDSSPLSGAQLFQQDGAINLGQRANSELGHYLDLQQDNRPVNGNRRPSPEQHRPRDDGRKSFYPTLNTVAPSPTTAVTPPERIPSPEKLDASVKISGPMNGAPIPSGFKFGGKDAPSANSSSAANDRREKAKSRSFWGFGKGDKSHPHPNFIPRAVFGVPLEEALDVAQMCNLPAIVFRSIQYLEAKKADQEEGIYRLSGSSAVIKGLKDRFNNEGDVDLLASDEYWDPHAIAGLLKSFLRELPSSILTRDLHLKFLAVIDFVDAQERIKELSQLIAALPLANYSLLRALTAHLILIVQNSNVNKMTMRNVGIVFSPTLGIPAGVFSLMLGEFNRVFNVDADNDDLGPKEGDGLLEHPSEPLRRNSRQYSDAAADQILGLTGRTLSTPAEETQSDGDDFSIQEESGTETTEGDATVESSSSSPSSAMHRDHGIRINAPDTPNTPTTKSPPTRASNMAASKGLNVAVTTSDRGNRHSRMMGLPSSPRPTTTPPSRDILSSASPTSHPTE